MVERKPKGEATREEAASALETAWTKLAAKEGRVTMEQIRRLLGAALKASSLNPETTKNELRVLHDAQDLITPGGIESATNWLEAQQLTAYQMGLISNLPSASPDPITQVWRQYEAKRRTEACSLAIILLCRRL